MGTELVKALPRALVSPDGREKLRRVLSSATRFATRRPKAACHPGISMRLLEEPGANIFFGYYDLTPFSGDGERLLACRCPESTGKQASGNVLENGYFDLEARGQSAFVPFGATTTWSWQQGCRLQWLPAAADTLVLYNRNVGKGHGCVIQNMATGRIEAEIGAPVFAVNPSGKKALGLNFPRLETCRPGYGYSDQADPWAGENAAAEDGVWLVDLESGTRQLILSLADAAAMEPQPSMAGAKHYFNHLLWNPSGSRFMVFHIWQGEDGRRMRLITSDASGENRYLTTNESHVSHYWWIDDETILLYSTHSDTGEHFHLYKDRHARAGILGKGVLSGDGHPSLRPGGRWLLADTLPDRLDERTAYLFDLDNEEKTIVARFFSPPRMVAEKKCDLHPRWSPDGRLIAVDTGHHERRSMAVIDISALLSPANQEI